MNFNNKKIIIRKLIEKLNPTYEELILHNGNEISKILSINNCNNHRKVLGINVRFEYKGKFLEDYSNNVDVMYSKIDEIILKFFNVLIEIENIDISKMDKYIQTAVTDTKLQETFSLIKKELPVRFSNNYNNNWLLCIEYPEILIEAIQDENIKTKIKEINTILKGYSALARI